MALRFTDKQILKVINRSPKWNGYAQVNNLLFPLVFSLPPNLVNIKLELEEKLVKLTEEGKEAVNWL